MNPLVLGAAVAGLLAGPSLYSLVQSGQMDESTALFRGLVVAAACALGATWVLGLVASYEAEWKRKNDLAALLKAIAEAEEAAQHQFDAAQRLAEAQAKSAADLKP